MERSSPVEKFDSKTLYTAKAILDTAGKNQTEKDVDIRPYLLQYGNWANTTPSKIILVPNPAHKRYNHRTVPVLLSDRDEIPNGEYCAENLRDERHPLTVSRGHLAVQDYSAGEYADTNLLYSGALVLEFDLITRDQKGRKIIYADPSVLAQEVKIQNMRQPLLVEPEIDMDDIERITDNSIGVPDVDSAIMVSTGTLLSEICAIMRIVEDETYRVEALTVDPCVRELMRVGKCHTEPLDMRLFDVAFLANYQLMGVKAVFYPTALVPPRESGSAGLNLEAPAVAHCKCLAFGVDALLRALPIIVEAVELNLTNNRVAHFKPDVEGTRNWMLPGHTKNASLAAPYHYAYLAGTSRDTLVLSNESMVTTLGVVQCGQPAMWWLNSVLPTVVSKAAISLRLYLLCHGGLCLNEWRRKLMFGNLGNEFPFRNKDLIVDQDVFLCGVCYVYLSNNPQLLTSLADPKEVTGGAKGGGESIANGDSEEKSPVPQLNSKIIEMYDSVLGVYSILEGAILNSGVDPTAWVDRGEIFWPNDHLIVHGPDMLKANTQTSRLGVTRNAPLKVGAIAKVLASALKSFKKCSISNPDLIIALALVEYVMRWQKISNNNSSTRVPNISLLKWDSFDFKQVWNTVIEPTEAGPANTTAVSFDTNQPPDAFMIDALINSTPSTFQSSADPKDCMFLWMIVALAERFCTMYNAVHNPCEYYDDVTTGRCGRRQMYYKGGKSAFEKACRVLAPIFRDFVTGDTDSPRFVCRRVRDRYEEKVENYKNAYNKKLIDVKMKERELSLQLGVTPLSYYDKFECGGHSLQQAGSLFISHSTDSPQNETVDWCDEEEEEDSYEHDPALPPEVESETALFRFFSLSNRVKTPNFYRALCHRQKYVSLSLVRYLSEYVSELLVCEPLADTNEALLQQVRDRSCVAGKWTIPFSFPVSAAQAAIEEDRGNTNECPCGRSEGCIKLLTVPESECTLNLVINMKYNVLTVERRFLTDVRFALGFTDKPTYTGLALHKRWLSVLQRKMKVVAMFTKPKESPYERMALNELEERMILQPRTEARLVALARRMVYKELGTDEMDGVAIREGAVAFVNGILTVALRGSSDVLERIVLASTVDQRGPVKILSPVIDDDAEIKKLALKSLTSEVKQRRNNKGGMVSVLREMSDTLHRGMVGGDLFDSSGDITHFASRVRAYGMSERAPEACLMTVLNGLTNCFRGSLPVDLVSMIDWRDVVFSGLTEGTYTVDETGAVFDAAKFLTCCCRLFFGHSVMCTLGFDEWKTLLQQEMGENWVADLALVYETYIQNSDIRPLENFIDGSQFFTTNRAAEEIALKRTINKSHRLAVWNDKGDVGGDVTLRAANLCAVEANISSNMSFSFILIATCLFRLFFEDATLKDLCLKRQWNVSKIMPFLPAFNAVGKIWAPQFLSSVQPDFALTCLSMGHFINVALDQTYFYRFVGFALGMVASTDAVIERLAVTIHDSFDFNGLSTKRWDELIDCHWKQVILGQRARLMSPPLSFLKRIVNRVVDSKHDNKIILREQERRVEAVMGRLASLLLVKCVNSEQMSHADIVQCCILCDDDLDVSSVEDYFRLLGTSCQSAEPSVGFSLYSNSCGDAKLAQASNSTRIMDTRVNFSKLSVDLKLDADEETIADPSSDANVSRLADTVMGGAGLTETIKKTCRSGVPPRQKTESAKTNNVFDVPLLDDGIGHRREVVLPDTHKLMATLTKLLRTAEVEDRASAVIDRLVGFLMLKMPFEDGSDLCGLLKPHVVRAGVEAIVRWNQFIQNEAARVKLDYQCRKPQEMYDITVVKPSDYNTSHRALFDVTVNTDAETEPSAKKINALGSKIGKGKEKVYANNRQVDRIAFQPTALPRGFSNKGISGVCADGMLFDACRVANIVSTRNTDTISNFSTSKKKCSKNIDKPLFVQRPGEVHHTSQTQIDSNAVEELYVLLNRDSADSENDRYIPIRKLWLCNSGIHPADQAAIMKKLKFRNYNRLWTKMYGRLIARLNRWGWLCQRNLNQPYFGIDYVSNELTENSPTVDTNAPLFHSSLLSRNEVQTMIEVATSQPLEGEPRRSAIVSREILSALFDVKGEFRPTALTNSLTLLHTPGTNYENGNDEKYEGSEQKLSTTTFTNMFEEIAAAFRNGVFMQDSFTMRQLKMVTPTNGTRNLDSAACLGLLMTTRRVEIDVQREEMVSSTNRNLLGDLKVKGRVEPMVNAPAGLTGTFAETVGAKQGYILCAAELKNQPFRELTHLREMSRLAADGTPCRALFESWSLTASVCSPGVATAAATIVKNSIKSMLKKRQPRYKPWRTKLCDDMAVISGGGVIDRMKSTQTVMTDWLSGVRQVNASSSRLLRGFKWDLASVGTCSITGLSPPTWRGDKQRKAGPCFLADPIVYPYWMTARQTFLSTVTTNSSIACATRLIARRVAKETVDTLFKDGTLYSVTMANTANTCLSLEENRYFLIDGCYLLGGRLDMTTIMCDTHIRTKLMVEKHVVLSSFLSFASTTAMLLAAIEGPAGNRGLAILEHMGRLRNYGKNHVSEKDFWSILNPMEKVDATVGVTVLDDGTFSHLTPPSVCCDDETYVFLATMYGVANIDPKVAFNDCEVDQVGHLALQKCYRDIVDDNTGIPKPHMVHIMRAMLNFGGFLGVAATGDGAKAHHMVYTIAIIALNMFKKTIAVNVGKKGNNLKTEMAKLIKAALWKAVDFTNISSFNDSGGSAGSTQANISYILGKKMIVVADEVGYQGSEVGEKKEGVTPMVWKNNDNVWTLLKECCRSTLVKLCQQQVNACAHGQRKRKRSDTEELVFEEGREKTNLSSAATYRMCCPSVCWWSDSGPFLVEFNPERVMMNALVRDDMPHMIRNSEIARKNPWLMESDAAFQIVQPESGLLPILGERILTNPVVKYVMYCDLQSLSVERLKLLTGKDGTLWNDPEYIESVVMEELGQSGVAHCPEADIAMFQPPPLGRESIAVSTYLDEGASVEQVFARGQSIMEDVRRHNSLEATLKFYLNRIEYGGVGWFIENRGGHSFVGPRVTVDMGRRLALLRRIAASDGSIAEALAKHYIPVIREPLKTKENCVYAMHTLPFGNELKISNKSNVALTTVQSTATLDAITPGIIKIRIAHNNAWTASSIFSDNNNVGYSSESISEDCEMCINRNIFDLLCHPRKYGFPKLSLAGDMLFKMDENDNKKTLERLVRLGGGVGRRHGKNVGGSNLIGNLGSFATMVRSTGMGNLVGVTETPGTDTNVHSDFLVALAQYGVTSTSSANGIEEVSGLVQKKMLPGQFSSNLIKLFCTPGATVTVRGLHEKPRTASAALSMWLISNSFTFKFFVDAALWKRMLVFSYDTNLMNAADDSSVANLIALYCAGSRVIHAHLLTQRASAEEEIECKENLSYHVAKWNSVYEPQTVNSNEKKNVAAILPCSILMEILKQGTFEMSDSSTNLVESINTYYTMYCPLLMRVCSASIMSNDRNQRQRKCLVDLLARNTAPAQDVKQTKDSSPPTETVMDIGGAAKSTAVKQTKDMGGNSSTARAHQHLCSLSPKSMSTFQRATDAARGEALKKIMAALKCALFMPVPFVKTDCIYGEGGTLRARLADNAGYISWYGPVVLPNLDSGVRGYNKLGGSIGVGAAIAKQLVDGWGSHDIRDACYSCHQLFILFELVHQFKLPNTQLKQVSRIRSDGVEMCLVLLAYRSIMHKMGYETCFDTNVSAKRKKKDVGSQTEWNMPTFPLLIINKSLMAQMRTTNLAGNHKKHCRVVATVLDLVGESLNPLFLCSDCRNMNR